MSKNKKLYLVAGIVVIAVLAVIFSSKSRKTDLPIDIILSPHYDDAALSLGGLIASKSGNTVVATFFTGMPDVAISTSWDAKSGFKDSSEAVKARTAENKKALENSSTTILDYGYLDNQYRLAQDDSDSIIQNISKDIQALIASYANSSTTIRVYGPAYFGKEITHPDHKLLHDAYANLIDSYPKANVDFYFYEDFPYIENFNKSSVVSIQKYLETETSFLLDPEQVMFSESILSDKMKMIEFYQSQVKALGTDTTDFIGDTERYFSARCGTQACEVVYKVFRAPTTPDFSF